MPPRSRRATSVVRSRAPSPELQVPVLESELHSNLALQWNPKTDFIAAIPTKNHGEATKNAAIKLIVRPVPLFPSQELRFSFGLRKLPDDTFVIDNVSSVSSVLQSDHVSVPAHSSANMKTLLTAAANAVKEQLLISGPSSDLSWVAQFTLKQLTEEFILLSNLDGDLIQISRMEPDELLFASLKSFPHVQIPRSSQQSELVVTCSQVLCTPSARISSRSVDIETLLASISPTLREEAVFEVNERNAIEREATCMKYLNLPVLDILSIVVADVRRRIGTDLPRSDLRPIPNVMARSYAKVSDSHNILRRESWGDVTENMSGLNINGFAQKHPVTGETMSIAPSFHLLSMHDICKLFSVAYMPWSKNNVISRTMAVFAHDFPDLQQLHVAFDERDLAFLKSSGHQYSHMTTQDGSAVERLSMTRATLLASTSKCTDSEASCTVVFLWDVQDYHLAELMNVMESVDRFMLVFCVNLSRFGSPQAFFANTVLMSPQVPCLLWSLELFSTERAVSLYVFLVAVRTSVAQKVNIATGIDAYPASTLTHGFQPAEIIKSCNAATGCVALVVTDISAVKSGISPQLQLMTYRDVSFYAPTVFASSYGMVVFLVSDTTTGSELDLIQTLAFKTNLTIAIIVSTAELPVGSVNSDPTLQNLLTESRETWPVEDRHSSE